MSLKKKKVLPKRVAKFPARQSNFFSIKSPKFWQLLNKIVYSENVAL